MNMEYRVVWVAPDHKNGDCLIKAVPCTYIIPLSYNTRVLECRKNPSLRSRSPKSGEQGCGFDPHGQKSFSAISFKACDNVTCLLSLGCVQIFVIVAMELL